MFTFHCQHGIAVRNNFDTALANYNLNGLPGFLSLSHFSWVFAKLKALPAAQLIITIPPFTVSMASPLTVVITPLTSVFICPSILIVMPLMVTPI